MRYVVPIQRRVRDERGSPHLSRSGSASPKFAARRGRGRRRRGRGGRRWVTNRFEEAADGGPGLKIGGVTLQMGEGEQTLGYRRVEHVLPVDGPVYVLGIVRADGRIGASEGDGWIPQTSMHLMVNSWFSSWLEGRRPKKNAHTYVNWISYEAQPPAG